MSESELLLRYLRVNNHSIELSEAKWELLLYQARSSGLLARLACYHKKGYFSVPSYVETHLDSARVFFNSQQRVLRWELHLLHKAFQQLQLPMVLLKGSAYAAANLNANYGRVFNDIDVLVPEERLQDIKNTLVWHGWFPEQLDPYDQNYYQQWMHELPPMQHIERGTFLDIHHNILPRTSRFFPDAKKLLANIVKTQEGDFWTLSREDLYLHSATHLFLGGEFENGLRDLTDMDLLFRQLSQQDSDFSEKLVSRGYVLGLSLPLFYALRYSHKLLLCPVPKVILQGIADCGPQPLVLKIMDFLFLRALMPNHSSADDNWTGIARWLLYIRSHWLKMPFYLLIPHLLRKSFMRLTKQT